MDQTRVKLSVTALAILAFVLAYFGYLELLFLLIAYAVFLDKSQPLAKMSFQALYLSVAYRVVMLVLGWIFRFFNWIFEMAEAYKALSGIGKVQGYINTVLSILVFVVYLLAIIQIISKKQCNLPLLGTLADKTLGIFTPKAAPQPNVGYQQPYQPPVQPYQPPAAPPQAGPPPSAPAAPSTWKCSCGHENAGNFCMKCGSPRS